MSGTNALRRPGTRPSFGFSPAQLFAGGYEGAWYDPSDLSSLFQNSNGTGAVTADGDPVGYMADKSGNGHHAVQATAANRPLLRISGALKYLELDGTNDLIQPTAMSGAAGADFCSGLAIRYTAKGAYHNVYDHTNSSPMLWIDDSNDLEYDGQASANIAGEEGNDIALVAQHLNASLLVSILLNGVAQADASREVPPDPTDAFTLFNRGGGSTYQGRFYGGVFIYRAVPSADRALLSTYLMAKMGL